MQLLIDYGILPNQEQLDAPFDNYEGQHFNGFFEFVVSRMNQKRSLVSDWSLARRLVDSPLRFDRDMLWAYFDLIIYAENDNLFLSRLLNRINVFKLAEVHLRNIFVSKKSNGQTLVENLIQNNQFSSVNELLEQVSKLQDGKRFLENAVSIALKHVKIDFVQTLFDRGFVDAIAPVDLIMSISLGGFKGTVAELSILQNRRFAYEGLQIKEHLQRDAFFASILATDPKRLVAIYGETCPDAETNLPGYLRYTLVKELLAEAKSACFTESVFLCPDNFGVQVWLEVPGATDIDLTRLQREHIVLVGSDFAELCQIINVPLETDSLKGRIGPYTLRFPLLNKRLEGQTSAKILAGTSNYNKWERTIQHAQVLKNEASAQRREVWNPNLVNSFKNLAMNTRADSNEIHPQELMKAFEGLVPSADLAPGSALTVQGPAGTGKTSVLAKLIGSSLQQYPQQTILVLCNSYEPLKELLGRCLQEQRNMRPLLVLSVEEHLKPKNLGSLEQFVAVKPNTARDAREERTRFEAKVQKANVVFITPYSLPSIENIFKSTKGLAATVLIDEAGKVSKMDFGVIIDSLLRHIRARLVLVGDQEQLPPFSRADTPASEGIFGAFVKRYQTAFLPKTHRFGPGLAEVVSKIFYDGRLATAKATRTPVKLLEHLAPQQKVGSSMQNKGEANFVLNEIATAVRSGKKEHAVICLYKEQAERVNQMLNNPEYRHLQGDVSVLTVDASQGRGYNHVYVLTSVSEGNGSEFVHDPRRLNVAMTRAKEAAYLVGNKEFFKRIQPGSKLYELYHAILNQNERAAASATTTTTTTTAPAKPNIQV